MKTATIVGAGIAGPVAALSLQRAGWDVTIYEQRSRDYPGSDHMINLTEDSVTYLDSLGVPHSAYTRGPRHIPIVLSHEDGEKVHGRTEPGTRWNSLHDALRAQCNVTYGHKVTSQPDTDMVIWADGIGSYGRNHLTTRHGDYSGEMLFRGMGPRKDNDLTWYNLIGPMDNGVLWSFVSYATWNSNGDPMRGWTLFLPTEKEPWDNTRTLSQSQFSALADYCGQYLTSDAMHMLTNATEITAAPQISWPPVDNQLVVSNGGQLNYIIGDAAGTVSPRTAMGANMAIAEGYFLDYPAYEWAGKFTEEADDLFSESAEMVGQFTGEHG